jgi:hypothetical protein
MRIRFYRGPMNGKVKKFPTSKGNNVIKVAIPNTKPNWVDVPVDVFTGDIPFTAHKMYNEYYYRKTQHTHPDGSVYFEWDQPKGTKF